MSRLSQRFLRWYVRRGDHPAKLRIVRWLTPRVVPPGGVLCDVGDGLRMWLNPDDDIEGKLFRGEPYEVRTLEFLRRNLATGMTAVFAGANNGLHVLVAATRVGKGGTVVGVEPQPGSLSRALRNVHASKPDAKVLLVSGGLGDSECVVPMAEHKPNRSGWASFVLRDPVQYPYQIQVLRFDTLAARLGLPPVDLMLLDVEGYELPALRGMTPETAPALLMVEAHPEVMRRMKATHRDYFEAVAALGYGVWNVDGTPATEGAPVIDNNLVCVKVGARPPAWVS